MKYHAIQSVLRAVGGVLLIAGFGCGEGGTVVPESPATLSVWPDGKLFGMVLGSEVALPVTLRSARGDALPLPSSFTLVSRAPAVVSVESSTVVRARSLSSTWLVGSVPVSTGIITDSVEVAVGCTLELQIKVTPASPETLFVGGSFTPAIELLTCGGQVQVRDTIRWLAGDSTVIRVDSVSGLTIGLRPGTTGVLPHGVHYRSLPGIPVTVVSPH